MCTDSTRFSQNPKSAAFTFIPRKDIIHTKSFDHNFNSKFENGLNKVENDGNKNLNVWQRVMKKLSFLIQPKSNNSAALDQPYPSRYPSAESNYETNSMNIEVLKTSSSDDSEESNAYRVNKIQSGKDKKRRKESSRRSRDGKKEEKIMKKMWRY